MSLLAREARQVPALTPALRGAEVAGGARLRAGCGRLSSGVLPLPGAQVSLDAAILGEMGRKAPLATPNLRCRRRHGLTSPAQDRAPLDFTLRHASAVSPPELAVELLVTQLITGKLSYGDAHACCLLAGINTAATDLGSFPLIN